MIKYARSLGMLLNISLMGALLAFCLSCLTTAGPEKSGLPILMYHNIVVDDPQSSSELPIDCFQNQMQYLYDHDYTALTLDQFLYYYEQGQFPERSVMITFDDGYRSFLDHAYPILVQFELSSVLFPVVSLTPGLERRLVWNEHLSFHHIRFMDKDSGLISIGSHTYDLHHITEHNQAAALRCPDETAEEHENRTYRDLLLSKLLLEMQTDHHITALAWPYGVYTPELIAIASSVGFDTIFTIKQEYTTPCTPLTELPRFNIDRSQTFCRVFEAR